MISMESIKNTNLTLDAHNDWAWSQADYRQVLVSLLTILRQQDGRIVELEKRKETSPSNQEPG